MNKLELLLPVSELDVDLSVRLVGDGHDQPQARPLVLQAEPLEDLDHEDGDLHLGEPPADTAPGAVAEGDVTEGVSPLVLRLTSQPSLGQELCRPAVLSLRPCGHEDPVDDGCRVGRCSSLTFRLGSLHKSPAL